MASESLLLKGCNLNVKLKVLKPKLLNTPTTYGFTALFVAEVTICHAVTFALPVLIPGIIDTAFVAII